MAYTWVYVRRMRWALAAGIAILGVMGVMYGTMDSRGDLAGNRISVVAGNQVVLLVPPIQGGVGGWCMTGIRDGAGCRMVQTMLGPIAAENWTVESPPPVVEGVALTTGEVAAVSVSGRSPIPTHGESGLPDMLRAVVVKLYYHRSDHIAGLDGPFPHFTALDARGKVIRQSATLGPALRFELPHRHWQIPGHAPHGVCEISATSLPGLTVRGGSVVTRLRSYPGLIGRPLFSCASTEYYLDKQPLLAGVLLDATNPGVTPAPLPGMVPVGRHQGMFAALGSEGEMVARRIPKAWLVVAKGSEVQQRLTLLEHLSASIPCFEQLPNRPGSQLAQGKSCR